MSKLHYIDLNDDKILIAAFEGTAEQTLALAVSYFKYRAAESRRAMQAVAPGMYENIYVSTGREVGKPIEVQCTIVTKPNGFNIWQSDGADKYELVDD